MYLGSPEAEPLAVHHVPEDVYNRNVELIMYLGSLRLILWLATMFKRMFTTMMLNLHCKE
jgi:hypothetical protein